jgi:hypothetical protein
MLDSVMRAFIPGSEAVEPEPDQQGAAGDLEDAKRKAGGSDQRQAQRKRNEQN